MVDAARSEGVSQSQSLGGESAGAEDLAAELISLNTSGGVVDMEGLRSDLTALGQVMQPGASGLLEQTVLSQLTPRQEGEFIRVQSGGMQTPTPLAANDPGPSTAEVVADLTQLTLDLVGIVEPTPFADGSNALISLGRSIGSAWNGEWGQAGGHLLNGTLSAVGIIPYLGDAAKAGKIGKWAQTVADAVTLAARSPAARATMEAPLREIARLVDQIPQSAIDALPASAREALDRMKTQLDEFLGTGARAADARPRVELDGGSTGSWPRELNTPVLRADTDYVVNGYTYRTNASGQVESVSGRLDLSTADRNGYQQRVAGRADRLPDDQGGHLIASIFNGAGDRVNLVPMDGNLNMGRWRALEDNLATAVREGRTVDVNINVRYPEGSARPDAFRIEYTIDGNTRVQTFRNQPGG